MSGQPLNVLAVLDAVEGWAREVSEEAIDGNNSRTEYAKDLRDFKVARVAVVELFEALRGLRNVCTLALTGKDGEQHVYFETRSRSFVFAEDALRAADAAIAKATGEQP